jgi:hypothetical protein
MRYRVMVAGAIVAMLTLVGCQQASSPATVEKEVSSAQQSAAKDTQRAMQDQAKTDAAANSDIASAEAKADAKKADSAYDTAVTEAQGRRDIALKKCDALVGNQQKACKDQAEALFDQSKADAKAIKAATSN